MCHDYRHLDAQDNMNIAKSLPELIVQAGGPSCKTMWEAMVPRFGMYLPQSDILHLAVQGRQINGINWLVCKFSQMTTQKNQEGRIVLSYNNDQKHYSRDGGVQENIRRSIVPEIVRLCSPIKMKELLRVANGESYDRSVGRID